MAVEEARERADELLRDWEQRNILALRAHAKSANRCSRWDVRLGSAGAALTAAIGTAIFATLQQDVSIEARVVVGVVTVIAAALTAVHTFAGLVTRKETYEQASRHHARVRRRIEVARTRLAAREEFDIWAEVDAICAALDDAAAATPNASGRVWDRTRREHKAEFTWWEKLARAAKGLPKAKRIGDPADVGGPRQPFRKDEHQP